MLPMYLIFYCVVGLHFVNNYSALPLQIAVHFNAAGEPDGWMGKQEFAMYHWAFIFLMSGIFAVLAWVIGRLPVSSIPIPNRDYWLAPERSAQTMEWLIDSLALLGILAACLIVAVDHYIMKAAIIGTNKADFSAIKTAVFWISAAMGLVVLRAMLKFRRPLGPK